jgi:hypothetical protein
MKYLFYIVLSSLLILGGGSLTAQDEAFRGGVGDGFSIDTFNAIFLDFTKGSLGDGFSKIEIQNLFSDFTRGGNSDGFSVINIGDDFNLMYTGGDSDGFTAVTTQNEFNPMYTGGDSDGFAYDKYGHIIYWTGDIGTGWNVAGNWANGIIPNYCNPVVIPSAVPNFPAVNAGLLRIGYYKDEGDYRCQRIKINANAEMTTRVNCFVENYDLISNRGILYVKNPAPDAFKNLGAGIILVKPNGEIIMKE